MAVIFRDRLEAGTLLAERLMTYKNKVDVIVLALPRGGVPVAFEVAKALHTMLDLLLVRKLGVPGQEELALGAISMNNVCVLNHSIIQELAISHKIIDQIKLTEGKELLRRNKIYRDGRPAPDVKNRTVILVDDGAATGASIQVSIKAISEENPARIVVAVPVASDSANKILTSQVNEFVCLQVPPHFYGVGAFYEDFRQINDEEVKQLMEQVQR